MTAIPVFVGDSRIGLLDPITMARLDDADLIAQLTAWRNRAKGAFFTQFEATPERTRTWLARQVLPDPTRRLFTISDSEGPVGTIGYIHLTRRSAELDNVLRGVRRGPPGLMRAAETALVSWLFETFGLEQIESSVFEGNDAAIKLYEAIGFRVVRRVPLLLTERNGEIAFVESDAAAGDGPAKLVLVLKRDDFTP